MNKILVYTLLLLLIAGMMPRQSEAQRYRIRIVSAGSMGRTSLLPDGVVSVRGRPVFEHDGAYLYCDSAWLNEQTNNLDAFGNVRIKSGDTLNLYGELMHYNGNTKLAHIQNKVRLVDNQSTLTTDFLVFDRNTQVASYTSGGKIVNKDNILTSKRGYYNTEKKQAFFRDDVVLMNPDSKMNCDTLYYNTRTSIASFLGPTIIKGKDNYIYCENGDYNRTTRQSRFSRNALMVDGNRRLTGDSLYYDDSIRFGKAIRNIIMVDTAEDIIIRGNYAEYWKKKGYSFVTNRAVAILGDSNDTLYLHADTLKALFDTVKDETRELFAFNHVRFFRKDLQGVCDSLHYGIADSLISLFRMPVLWSDENQLTADTILIYTGKESIKLIKMFSNSFITSRDSTNTFNQVKGRFMTGHFTNSKLYRIDVEGNAESVYFVREDDKSLVGLNKSRGSRLKLYIEDKKIRLISYFDKTDGNMLPEDKFTPEAKQLKGFAWHLSKRPLRKEDILLGMPE